MHWALYIVMVYGLAQSRDSCRIFRPIYIFWVGSIMFSLFAFLPGACIGAHSDQIKLSSFLNVPYAVIPLTFLKRVMSHKITPVQANSPPKAFSLFFIIAFSISILFVFVRFCGAGGSQWPVAVDWVKEYEPILLDDTRFFHMQAYVWFLYVVPYFVVNVYVLLWGAGEWGWLVCDSAAFVAGGAAQTQFSLLASVFCKLTPEKFQFPGGPDELAVYLFLHAGLLFVVPILFGAYCFHYPAFNGGLLASGKEKVN